MKKIVFILLLICLAGAVYWYTQKPEAVPVDTEIKTYRNANLGIYFSYPKILTASTTNSMVVLHHDIPFTNNGDCDMMGDEKTYERLTDFEVRMQTLNKNLVDTMKTLSPYIPEENFVNGEVVESPGFIDSYTAGNFSGFAIYEGAEGCGQVTYYFPVNNNETLVIQKASIQALNTSVRSESSINAVLAVPGVISNEKSEEIFAQILQTLEVR